MTAVPEAPAPRLGRLPSAAERTLANGLRVIAVSRKGVPMVELRLRLPTPDTSATVKARKLLMAQTMLGGTAGMDAESIATRLDELGATLFVGSGADSVAASGSALATRLGEFLALVGEVLGGAAYPTARVKNERERLRHQLVLRRSQPEVLASEALRHRLFGRHPYGLPMPAPDAAARIGRGSLQALHRSIVNPTGATLVLAGHISPKAAIDIVERALSDWRGDEPPAPLAEQPAPRPGPVVLVDRPGAVQTNIRIGGLAVPRTHPDHPALSLANLVFGGYFGSRLSKNIREDKGYTYSPRSAVEHAAAGSRFVAAADVATEVTAAALTEIRYELARIAATTVDSAELDKARRYRIGSLMIGTQTQSGLAGQLSALAAAGLDVRYLRELPAALNKVTAADLRAAAVRHLRHDKLVTVMVGDAERVMPDLSAIADVEIVGGRE